MKVGNLDKWGDIPKCVNLLFFSQLVNELLFDYSIPSNRVSTLNSHYLCLDAIAVILGIEKGDVREAALSPIVEELKASLEKDVVFANSFHMRPISYYVKYVGKKYCECKDEPNLNYRTSKQIVEALNTRFFSGMSYYNSLKEKIVDVVIGNLKTDQKDLFQLTKSLLTELINAGYSLEYIRYVMNRLFWNPSEPVLTPDRILLFFEYLSFEPKIVKPFLK